MTQQMTLLNHIRELRDRVIRSLIALTLGTIVGFFFNQQTRVFLEEPYIKITGNKLGFLSPAEGFTQAMKVSLFLGLVMAAPIIIYQVWRFVAPALSGREKRFIVPLSIVMALLFVAGISLAYWTLPLALRVLFSFAGESVEPTITEPFYLSFVLRYMLGFGFGFQFPVALFAASALGMLTSRKLRSAWRGAMVTIVAVAALIMPGGDPIPLLILAVPMYLLYEATILAIKLILRK
ncbi:sec-independent protein translocase protein TatC [bacterium BMS3Bbin02]|nr:sec-independent protein translocase protein TatC [bacterium BMS3Bbin02]